MLKRGGHFVVKVRQGAEHDAFRSTLRKQFRRVVAVKPDSSRAESAEHFMLGLGYRGGGGAPKRRVKTES